MRLATVSHQGQAKVVAATETNDLIDLRKAARRKGEDGAVFADMLSLINAGEAGLKTARALLLSADEDEKMSVSDVSFLPPIMPVQYRDCLVFEEHLANCFKVMGATMPVPPSIPPVWYEQPLYYKGNRMSFIGHGTDVQWPAYAEFLDIELELAIVVGKTGKDISKDAAPAHIFGYSILNDVSARDAQMREMPGQLGPCKGKDFDTGNILGPYILTADEVVHPIAVNMEARVNGERWGGGNSSQMQHNFADILAHISSSETIYAGEVIGSGTVGTGCGLEIGKRLQDGDVFELEIENIGILANRIIKAG